MKKLIALASMLAFAGQAHAGGRLDTFKFTGVSTVEGFEDVRVVPMFWDVRCSSVSYVVDDVPANAGLPEEIPATVIRREMQTAMNQWNQIPTSYISMNVVALKALNNGLPNFDFVNEVTFEAPSGSPFAGAAATRVLQRDMDFAVGDDMDEDGDSDVYDPAVAGRTSCFDFDRDGDIEFSAGSYKAGTILDSDVVFNPEVFWSTLPAGDEAFDIRAVAVHEFGHAHGLSHGLINQISPTDGTASTMYPFLDSGDEASERAQRSLHSDDIAWSSFVYPEGTAESGPPALQRGDRAFRTDYGLIKGEVKQRGMGVAGASVQALSGGRAVSEGFSGTARAFANAFGEVLVFDPAIDGVSSIIDGKYTIPVPSGTYDLALEALDGIPVGPGSISRVSQVGAMLGQNVFPEEFRSAPGMESNREAMPGVSAPVMVTNGGMTNGVNLVTNDEVTLRNAEAADVFGDGSLLGVRDVIWAEHFTNAEVLAQLDAGGVLTSAQFQTTVSDNSVVPKYKRAGLFFGRVNPDGSAAVDLARPIFAKSGFVGQELDLAPLFSGSPMQSVAIRNRLRSDPTLDVFAVLEAANEFETGSSGSPPMLAISFGSINPGRSFLSIGGSPLTVAEFFAWSIELHFAMPRR